MIDSQIMRVPSTPIVVEHLALELMLRRFSLMGLPGVENTERRHGSTLRVWPILDITERIQNLTDETMLP